MAAAQHSGKDWPLSMVQAPTSSQNLSALTATIRSVLLCISYICTRRLYMQLIAAVTASARLEIWMC